MGCPAATPGGQIPVVMQISTVGGSMPVAGRTWGLVAAERTQPCPFASNQRLLHSGCTANLVFEFIETLAKAVQAHLSPFSLPCASFPAVLIRCKIVGIGNRFGVLMAHNNAVPVEHAVTK